MQVLGADCLPESPLPSARCPVQGASLVARVPVLESPPPGSRRGGGSRLRGPSDLQQPDPDRVEDQPVGQISTRRVGADGGDCGQYVLQTLGLAVRHSGTTPAAMRRETSDLSPSAGTRSMVEPSTDSSASRARPRRIRLVPGGKSASRSRSLPGRSSPRATLPNTRSPVRPCAAAVSTRRLRLRRTRRRNSLAASPDSRGQNGRTSRSGGCQWVQPAGIRGRSGADRGLRREVAWPPCAHRDVRFLPGPGGSSDVGVALAASGNNKGKKLPLLATSNL